MFVLAPPLVNQSLPALLVAAFLSHFPPRRRAPSPSYDSLLSSSLPPIPHHLTSLQPLTLYSLSPCLAFLNSRPLEGILFVRVRFAVLHFVHTRTRLFLAVSGVRISNIVDSC